MVMLPRDRSHKVGGIELGSYKMSSSLRAMGSNHGFTPRGAPPQEEEDAITNLAHSISGVFK